MALEMGHEQRAERADPLPGGTSLRHDPAHQRRPDPPSPKLGGDLGMDRHEAATRSHANAAVVDPTSELIAEMRFVAAVLGHVTDLELGPGGARGPGRGHVAGASEPIDGGGG